MDATATGAAVDVDSRLYNLIVNIEDSNFPTAINKQRNTVVKYTKIPDFDLDSKGWPHSNVSQQPRLRRVTSVNDHLMHSSRSLQIDMLPMQRMQVASQTQRKIVTISEDEDTISHRRYDKLFSDRSPKSGKKYIFGDPSTKMQRIKFNESNQAPRKQFSSIQVKASPKSTQKPVGSMHRSVQVEDKPSRSTARFRNISTNKRETKPSAKLNNVNNAVVSEPRRTYTSKSCIREGSNNSPKDVLNTDRSQRRSFKYSADNARSPQSDVAQKNNSISNNNDKFESDLKANTKKKSSEKTKNGAKKPESLRISEAKRNKGEYNVVPKSPSRFTFTKHFVKPLKEISLPKSQNDTMIRVPLENSSMKKLSQTEEENMRDFGTQIVPNCTDVEVATTSIRCVNQLTDMDDFHECFNDFNTKTIAENVNKDDLLINEVKTENTINTFDSLNIPNVSLTKDKSEPKYLVQTLSLPNLQIPALTISPHRDDDKLRSGSYIIGRATLTYTTKQKINIHVVGNDESLEPSPLPSYPLSVVSIFKKEVKNRDSKNVLPRRPSHKPIKSYMEDLQSPNCSYLFNRDKLVKPSDIISGIGMNSGLLKSDFISEQFQRELNFIDSFFESLQYLESCSLSDKSLSLNKSQKWLSNNLELDNSDYNKFLSNLELDDSYTIASKSLRLLNLLIRDEQRRARNLLFVLKMREDALKDFTKSQILWLENKKKQENTDISTLKKKQRGALLKLQHECGEMQRMRKALLTLSEKRKAALIRTKKNIELKLNSNVDVEKILSDKKKLRRNYSSDRANAPLKCFELSSSGCEEIVIRPSKSDTVPLMSETVPTVQTLTSAEKCIQTSENIVETVSTQTTAKNYVSVDGGYLNILFQDLKMPQIFSNGKQYEVNEEALRNVLNSANSVNTINESSDVVERLMSDSKSRDSKSSSPSTARSLVEEFDQYYKGLAEDKEFSSQDEITDQVDTPKSEIEVALRTDTELNEDDIFDDAKLKIGHLETSNHVEVTNKDMLEMSEKEAQGEEERVEEGLAGPLTVPAGAAAGSLEELITTTNKTPITTCTESGMVGIEPSCQPTSTSSVDVEAERLRRQQIAIEREIKALEQQQCQLLVVREIPDKPPPPYTPPAAPAHPSPRRFRLDDVTDQLVVEQLRGEGREVDATDSFEVFVKDYCEEVLDRQKEEQSDVPWDACNLLPQKASTDLDTVVKNTCDELRSVFTAVPATSVTGLGTRRSDHIDDILFAEWRRCEPEWTALHVDEAVVKNQVFEGIFQKVLSETIDEYKRKVVGVESSFSNGPASRPRKTVRRSSHARR